MGNHPYLNPNLCYILTQILASLAKRLSELVDKWTLYFQSLFNFNNQIIPIIRFYLFQKNMWNTNNLLIFITQRAAEVYKRDFTHLLNNLTNSHFDFTPLFIMLVLDLLLLKFSTKMKQVNQWTPFKVQLLHIYSWIIDALVEH